MANDDGKRAYFEEADLDDSRFGKIKLPVEGVEAIVKNVSEQWRRLTNDMVRMGVPDKDGILAPTTDYAAEDLSLVFMRNGRMCAITLSELRLGDSEHKTFDTPEQWSNISNHIVDAALSALRGRDPTTLN